MVTRRTSDQIIQAINEVCVIAAGSRREFPTQLLQACLAYGLAVIVRTTTDVTEASAETILKTTETVDVCGPRHLISSQARTAATAMAQQRAAGNPVDTASRADVPAVEVAAALTAMLVQAQILYFVFKDAHQTPLGPAADTATTPRPASSQNPAHEHTS